MDYALHTIAAALAELSDDELRAVIDSTNGVVQTAPGLLAWVEAACDWELNCRAGMEYELQPPEATVPYEENAASIGAAMTLRATVAQESSAVLALFDTLVEVLTGAGRKH